MGKAKRFDDNEPLGNKQFEFVNDTMRILQGLTSGLIQHGTGNGVQWVMETEFPNKPPKHDRTFGTAKKWVRGIMAKCIEMIDKAEEANE